MPGSAIDTITINHAESGLAEGLVLDGPRLSRGLVVALAALAVAVGLWTNAAQADAALPHYKVVVSAGQELLRCGSVQGEPDQRSPPAVAGGPLALLLRPATRVRGAQALTVSAQLWPAALALATTVQRAESGALRVRLQVPPAAPGSALRLQVRRGVAAQVLLLPLGAGPALLRGADEGCAEAAARE